MSTPRSSSRPASPTRSRRASRRELLVIGGPSTLSVEIARSVLAGFGSEVTAVQVGVRAALGATGSAPEPSLLARLAQDALAIPAPIVVSAGSRRPNARPPGTTYYGASMAVLFVFFAAQFGVVGLLAERRTGTLARMLASPIGPSAILFGKVLVSLVLAIVSMSVMVIGDHAPPGRQLGRPAGRRRARACDGDRGHGHRDARRGVRQDGGTGRRRPSPSWR